MANPGLVDSGEVHLELTSTGQSSVPADFRAYARFLLPKVARPHMAAMARRGPGPADLPLLTRFAAYYPDPDVHRMILAALARAVPEKHVTRAFLRLYDIDGPNRRERRQRIREVLSVFEPALLAPIWGSSDRGEKLEIVAILRRMRGDHLERFMTNLTISDDADPVLRCLSIDIWERLDDEAAVRVLLRRLRKRNPRLRAQSLEALVRVLERPEAIRLLVRCVDDPDPEPRATALGWLVRLGHRRAREGLAGMLSSEDLDAQAAATAQLKGLARPADLDDSSSRAATRTRQGRALKIPPAGPGRSGAAATTGRIGIVGSASRSASVDTDRIPLITREPAGH